MATNGDISPTQRIGPWRIVGWGAAGALFLLPLIAMQFTREVQWDETDFIVFGLMIGTVGGLFELAVRISRNWAYRSAFALALVAAFLVTWVNLAVGIVGSEDNPSNLLFFGALGLAIFGAAFVRMKARGMENVMYVTAIAIIAAFVVAQTSARDELWVSPVREALGTGVFALMFAGSALLFRKAAKS